MATFVGTAAGRVPNGFPITPVTPVTSPVCWSLDGVSSRIPGPADDEMTGPAR